MSIHSLLADGLVCVHLAYVSYVVFGQLAIMVGWPMGWRWIRNPWFRISHLVMILIVAVEALVDFECPLTTWERNLRITAGQIPANFQDLPEWQEKDLSFVGGLLRSVMYFDSSWADFLSMCYYVAAGVVVATVLLVPPRFRRTAPAPSPKPATDPVASGTPPHAQN